MSLNTTPTPTLSDYLSFRYSAGGHAVTRLVSQRIGAVFAWLAMHVGLRPTAVTLLGTLTFICAATLFVTLPSGYWPAASVLVLFQMAYGLDCADGQLARATQQTSAFGAWLDVACDYVRNVMLGAAMAQWLMRNGYSPGMAVIVGAVFTAGTAVQLHTSTALRGGSGQRSLHTAGLFAKLRAAVTALMDTPFVLMLLTLLRSETALLAGYAVMVGIVSFGSACYLANRRL